MAKTALLFIKYIISNQGPLSLRAQRVLASDYEGHLIPHEGFHFGQRARQAMGRADQSCRTKLLGEKKKRGALYGAPHFLEPSNQTKLTVILA